MSGSTKPGEGLLVDHDRSDLDPVANFGVELWTLIEQIAITCPYLVMAGGEQRAVWLNDLRLHRVTDDELLNVATVERVQLLIDYLTWRTHRNLLSLACHPRHAYSSIRPRWDPCGETTVVVRSGITLDVSMSCSVLPSIGRVVPTPTPS
jgi:hypothetical protein